MSLLQKFTNLFKQNDASSTLQKLLKPSTTNELQQAIKNFEVLLSNQTTAIFGLLRQREALINMDPKPESLLNLLLVIHSEISNDEVCNQLRQSPIYWLDCLMTENRESFMIIERMITEQSTNSYIPQQQQISQQQTQSKGEKLDDKRKARMEMNQKLQNPILNTQVANNTDTQSIKPKMFCIIYYSFLQKLSINQQVYQSSRQMKYPEDESDVIWIYKIQNVMQMGLKLLQCQQKNYRPYQLLIYQDLFYFQSFIKQEIEILVQKEQNIQIYELYCEFSRAKQILEKFEPQHSFHLKLSSQFLDEFQRNSIKEKVKNQFVQQKKNKESLKDNQENVDQLNFQDFEANYDFEREIVMKKFFDNGPSTQMSEIFTVQESLKDEKIAKNLDLDVGTLNDYLDKNSTDPNPRLPNKRLDRKAYRRTDQLPKKFEQTKEEKETVKASEIISGIIKDVFKMDINEFEQMNSPDKLNKEYKFQEIDPEKRKFLRMKIPIQKKLEQFEQELVNSRSDLKLKIQEIRVPQQKNAGNSSQKDDNTYSRPNSQKVKQNSGSNKLFFNNNNNESDAIDSHVWLQNRLDKMLRLNQKNIDTQKFWQDYWSGINYQEFRTYQEYQQQHKKPLIGQDLQSSGDYKSNKSQQKNDFEIVVTIKSQSAITIKNKQINSEHILYLMMTLPPLVNLVRVEFFRTQLNETAFKQLTVLLSECRRLDYLNFSGNTYPRNQHVKTLLLELQNLKILRMSDMKISTKCFLDLCEILIQTNIQEIDFSNNLLDHHVYEALVGLIKYMPSLTQMDFTQNNIIINQALPLQKRPQSWEYLEKVKLSYQRRVEILI